MDNQERNREALIEHIAEQDRIIRRRNQQIGELQAINFALQGDLQGQPLTPSEALIERAEKAELERDMAREDRQELQERLAIQQKMAEQPRPLTPDAITDEMVNRVYDVLTDAEFNTFPSGAIAIRHLKDVSRKALVAALTEPPTRPEEKVEGVLRRYWSGDIDGTDLADRIVEEMNR